MPEIVEPDGGEPGLFEEWCKGPLSQVGRVQERSPLGGEDIECGIEIGVSNKRGVLSRSLTEGGVQERRLAETYRGYADALNDGWPRTAAMLRRISETYASWARREDVEAELREDLWR